MDRKDLYAFVMYSIDFEDYSDVSNDFCTLLWCFWFIYWLWSHYSDVSIDFCDISMFLLTLKTIPLFLLTLKDVSIDFEVYSDVSIDFCDVSDSSIDFEHYFNDLRLGFGLFYWLYSNVSIPTLFQPFSPSQNGLPSSSSQAVNATSFVYKFSYSYTCSLSWQSQNDLPSSLSMIKKREKVQQ